MSNVNVWNLINSMRSVNKWSDSIQANINGSTRNAFKGADIFFGGNTTSTERPVTSVLYGIQTAEQTFNVSHTEIDWSQGGLALTNKDYDYAVQGDGFFMVTENVPDNTTTQKIYYTRDGQFHQDDTGRLRTDNGLYVVTRADAFAKGLVASNTPVGTPVTSPDYLALAMPSTLDDLVYSKFGATIYTNSTTNPMSYGLSDTGLFGEIHNKYIETSNVDNDKQIAQLSNNKTYQDVLTKQLIVYYANIDVGINLIK